MKKNYTGVFTITFTVLTTAALFALALFGCEQAAGSDSGGTPEQSPVINVLPGNQCISVSWENFPVISIFAGTGDEMPDSSEGTVEINGDSAVINGLKNNTAYNVWVVESTGENRKITGEKVTPVNAGIPAGKFAGSSFIYELNGATYTKYRNNGFNAPSGIVYTGTIVFADSSGAIIIKASEGAYRAVKVTYENKLYKVAEATETPEIPDDKNGTITASFGEADTANIVVGKLVTFDSNGGNTEASPAAVAVETGKTVGTLPVPPAKANFQFSGWKKADGSAFTAETVIDSNITVYAQWWTAEGGTKTFANMDDMKYFLENFYGENSAANPVDIVLTGAITTDDLKSNENDNLGKIFDMLDGKYVTLNMSAVTGTEIADTADTIVTTRLNKDKLVSITLPYTIVKVGNYSFSGCTSLKSVEFPDTLETLGKGAFTGCTALEAVELASTVLTSPVDTNGTNGFMSGAFKGCTALSTVTLPDTVTAIWDSTFEGCASLDFDAAFFTNIEKIGASAFKDSGITLITLTEKVTQLGANAFENCKKLVTVNLSAVNSITSFANYMFANCSELKNLTLPTEGLSFIGNYTFQNCIELEEVTLPTSLTYIGTNYTFDGCKKLETVVWESAPADSKIGPPSAAPAGIFKGCEALKELAIPEQVAAVAKSMANAVFENSGLEKVTLPASFTAICGNAFKNAKNLSEIIILKSSSSGIITLPNANAFTGTQITTSNGNAHIYVPDEATVTAYKGAKIWSTFADLISVKPTD